MSRAAIAKKILEIVRFRIANTLDCPPETLPNLSLGDAINCLFILNGSHSTLGSFHESIRSVYQIVGKDLLWRVPGSDPEEPPTPELVQ
jgi:hypothetical protein